MLTKEQRPMLRFLIVQTAASVVGLQCWMILFNFAIAIRTYFQKVADPADIAPSIAVGFTINHIAAVVMPAIGGLLWMVDYRIPFIAGAVFSLVSLLAVQDIPRLAR